MVGALLVVLALILGAWFARRAARAPEDRRSPRRAATYSVMAAFFNDPSVPESSGQLVLFVEGSPSRCVRCSARVHFYRVPPSDMERALRRAAWSVAGIESRRDPLSGQRGAIIFLRPAAPIAGSYSKIEAHWGSVTVG